MRRTAVALLIGALALGTVACSSATKPKALPTTTTASTLPPTTTTPTTSPPAPPSFDGTTSADAATTAAALARAEVAALDPNTAPDVLHSAAIALELGYRRIAGLDVSFEQAVAAAMPVYEHRKAMAENVAASRHLIALAGRSTPRPAPPADWKIVTPAPAAELETYYKQASADTGVPWEILAAVHLIETRLGRIRGASSAGALGPMQFLPATWAAYGEGDIESNRDAIAAAARYLHANGAPERMDDALFRYNHSMQYVEAVKAYARRITDNNAAFRGYHEWQVLYRTASGSVILPDGWPAVPAIPVLL